MILKDGSEVPDARVHEIMSELRRCSRLARRTLRQAVYRRENEAEILAAHPVLLHKGGMSAAAVAVIMNAVRPDGSLVNPGE